MINSLLITFVTPPLTQHALQWEAYTLGRSPPAVEPGAELTLAQEQAIAANVELARSAGSRYLVQRWGDGTYCDKAARKRQIEIQVRLPAFAPTR